MKLGIVICNYNKEDYVINCIQSVLESKFQDFDLYVVDNASTDQSVARVKQTYKDNVILIENKENLGGSGGFNTGIKRVLEGNYEYLMCLDNDVLVDENAIGALLKFLETHPQVGMVGSKVYHMSNPDYVQQFGLLVNFDTFGLETLYADQYDDSTIPEVVYCDTVAACSVMLPVDVVRDVGIMPEDNFLYWDDIEWGVKVKKAGYQVAAFGESKVLHEMGAFQRKSNVQSYYHYRNGLNFFMKYTPKDRVDVMSIYQLLYIFDSAYEAMQQEKHSLMKTIMFAYQDALKGIRGKIPEDEILALDTSNNDESNDVESKDFKFARTLFLYMNQSLLLQAMQHLYG